jgi:hypothetical protein
MLPLGHLSLGYLLYTGISRLLQRRPPAAGPTIALAVATQLPDLLDKPLSWTLGILPTGRTLGHSLFTVVGLSLVVYRIGQRIDRPAVGPAFAIGYGSHLLGDLYVALGSESETLLFFLWPLIPQEPYTTPPSTDIYVSVAIGSVAVAAYLAVFGAFAAVSIRLSERVDWLFLGFLIASTAGTIAVLSVMGIGLSSIVFEIVLAQVAVAIWIRDGTPGLPLHRI